MSLQQERDDAVKMLLRIGEETINAGYPGGDRDQTLANVRQMARDLLEEKRRRISSEKAVLSALDADESKRVLCRRIEELTAEVEGLRKAGER